MQKNNINIVGHIVEHFSACWTNELKKKSRKTKAVQTDRFKLGRLINRFFPFSTYVEKSGCNSHEQSHLWRLKKELYKCYNKSSLPTFSWQNRAENVVKAFKSADSACTFKNPQAMWKHWLQVVECSVQWRLCWVLMWSKSEPRSF